MLGQKVAEIYQIGDRAIISTRPPAGKLKTIGLVFLLRCESNLPASLLPTRRVANVSYAYRY